MMSASTLVRRRNRPVPAVLISQVRSPRRKFRRSLVAYAVVELQGVEAESPWSRVVCWAAVRLPHSNGMPAAPLYEMIVRAVGACAAIGPTAKVVAQVEPVATP